MSAIKDSLKMLVAKETLVEGSQIAAGSVATPLVSGVITALLNRVKSGLVKDSGLVSRGVDFISAAVTASLAGIISKNPKVVGNVLLGGISGTLSDIASNNLLPAINLGEYLTTEQLGEYLTTNQLGDYVTVESTKNAQVANSMDESF